MKKGPKRRTTNDNIQDDIIRYRKNFLSTLEIHQKLKDEKEISVSISTP